MNVLRQTSARALRRNARPFSDAAAVPDTGRYFVEFAAVGGLGGVVAMGLNTLFDFNTNEPATDRMAKKILENHKALGLMPSEMDLMKARNAASEWGAQRQDLEAAIKSAGH